MSQDSLRLARRAARPDSGSPLAGGSVRLADLCADGVRADLDGERLVIPSGHCPRRVIDLTHRGDGGVAFRPSAAAHYLLPCRARDLRAAGLAWVDRHVRADDVLPAADA